MPIGTAPAWLRPRVDRRALSIAAIATGGVLFLITSLVSPLAGADKPRPAARSAAPSTLGVVFPFAAVAPAATLSASPTSAAPSKARKKVAQSTSRIAYELAANGIPTVALNAYRVAAARTDNALPGCGIDWSLLAAIGRAESDHGRVNGSVLHEDGTSTPRIIGPALDGTVWDRIPAPPNGLALDGDAVYAHALGPMQFIPSTWAAVGADADGDGKADIFDINDAALAAARYLCAAGGDLRTEAGKKRAVLAYNHNSTYLAQVLALADAYHRGVPISGLPVGNTTGALPGVSGSLPPANPGAPIAADPSPSHGRTTTPSTGTSSSRASSGSPRPGGQSSPARPSSSAAAPSTPAASSPAPTTAKPSSSAPAPASTCTPLQIALNLCP